MPAIRDLNRAFDSGFITHQDFFDGVTRLAGKRPPDIEELTEPPITKNVELLKYISTLTPKYKIGILSSISSDWITRVLLTPHDQALFDDMVLSYQVNLTKPDPKIFQLACDRLGVDPSEAVMIDDVESYVAAAKGIGMHGIVYKDLNEFKTELALLLDSNS